MQTISLSNNSGIIKSFLAAICGTALLAISSKIQTPFTLVPATMQTFVVLFLGMVLGYKLAVATVILYLIEGSIGLPVFAKGGGFAYLMGPTGGYLIGFILTAFFAGMIKIKNDPIVIFICLLLSVSASYVFGLLGLWNYMGLDKSFNQVFLLGAQPFLLIEIYKILILSVLSKQILKLRRFI
ncbi:biotin transporter BioY [Candidatus Pelagibacter sp. Uisw_134_02]|jgi:biotin transport system substrate-specific component|uniref:biotin transporter BioY n=1 Tax=Candidatus Pelagibacter sp. Uisw_134_02 TaxID=3230990 RepID=UPI0039EA0064